MHEFGTTSCVTGTLLAGYVGLVSPAASWAQPQVSSPSSASRFLPVGEAAPHYVCFPNIDGLSLSLSLARSLPQIIRNILSAVHKSGTFRLHLEQLDWCHRYQKVATKESLTFWQIETGYKLCSFTFMHVSVCSSMRHRGPLRQSWTYKGAIKQHLTSYTLILNNITFTWSNRLLHAHHCA